MTPHLVRVVLAATGLALAIAGGAAIIPALNAPELTVAPLSLGPEAARYPAFAVEQVAVRQRLRNSERFPRLGDLPKSEAIARLSTLAIRAMLTGVAPTQSQYSADFLGNRSVVAVPENHLLGMTRQSDCTLRLSGASFALQSGPLLTYSVDSSADNYQVILHNLAGLQTSTGTFGPDCGDLKTVIGSRRAIYLGRTSSGVRVGAASGYNAASGRDEVFVLAANQDESFRSFSSLPNPDDSQGVTAADINTDGNNDVVSVNGSFAGGIKPSITVHFGSADGSFLSPLRIELAGTNPISTVSDDFDGDGKLDLVAFTGDQSEYFISFVKGKGDGTFAPPVASRITPPTGLFSPVYKGLVSTDISGSGHKDIISGEGILLRGNGDGSFSQSASPVFPDTIISGSSGGHVIAADLDKDGQLDLAVGTSSSITILSGNGAGPFRITHAYANINNVGYLNAADMDGDGSIDLYSGLGNDGAFGGDNYEIGKGYALMGRGDGSFAGAPVQPFVYTGTNLADVNGDGEIDAIGVNLDRTLTTYLGDGHGGFNALGTLITTPITLNGSQYTLDDIESLALGDVSGDGKVDLLYIGKDFNGPSPSGYLMPGIFVAMGKGDGSFSAPIFTAVPGFVMPPALDYNAKISNLRLGDLNGDGKSDAIYGYSDGAYVVQPYSLTYTLGTATQLSNGDGSFQSPLLIPFYSGQTESPLTSKVAAMLDANQDGKNDLLFLTENQANDTSPVGNPCLIELRLGNGNGSFQNAVTVPGPDQMPGLMFGTQYAKIAVVDMSADGISDIVSLGASSSGTIQVAVAPGHGDGSFEPAILKNFGAQYLFEDALAVADFNGDGDQDVLLSGYIGAADSGISFGNGDGTLQSLTQGAAEVPNQAVHLVSGGATVALNLNGDGVPDAISGRVTLLSVPPASGVTSTTSTSLQVSTDLLTIQQSLDLTATVSPVNDPVVPTGSITFFDSGDAVGSGSLSESGTATLTLSELTAGTHRFTASYSGDSHYGKGTSNIRSVNVVDASATALLEQSESDDPVPVRTAFSYVVTFTNLAETAASAVRIVDTPPGKARILSIAPSQGKCKGKRPAVCGLGTIAPRDHASVTITLIRSRSGVSRNQAVATYKLPRTGSKKLKAYRIARTERTTISSP